MTREKEVFERAIRSSALPQILRTYRLVLTTISFPLSNITCGRYCNQFNTEMKLVRKRYQNVTFLAPSLLYVARFSRNCNMATNVKKIPNTKFYGNQGSRSVPCGLRERERDRQTEKQDRERETDRQGQTDKQPDRKTREERRKNMMQLTVYLLLCSKHDLLTRTLINIRQAKLFYCIQDYMFRPFKRSSSDLLTDRVNRCCVHVGIAIGLHR